MKYEMVPATKIGKIAKKSLPENISLDHTLKFGIDCYESGMVEVLKDIAILDLEKGVGSIKPSNYTKQLMQKSQEKYQAIKEKLTSEEDEELLFEYSDTMTSLAGAEAGDYYIMGFIRGYRYLKKQVAFRSDYGNEFPEDDE